MNSSIITIVSICLYWCRDEVARILDSDIDFSYIYKYNFHEAIISIISFQHVQNEVFKCARKCATEMFRFMHNMTDKVSFVSTEVHVCIHKCSIHLYCCMTYFRHFLHIWFPFANPLMNLVESPEPCELCKPSKAEKCCDIAA